MVKQMFKYKSPLSRILDGTNMPSVAEDETVDSGVIVAEDSELTTEPTEPETPEAEAALQSEIQLAGSDAIASLAFAERLEALNTPNVENALDAPAPQLVEPAPMPDPHPGPGESVEAPEADASNAKRGRRVKTTFLGFGNQADPIEDILKSAEPVKNATQQHEAYPVGWLVVTKGPGRGTSVMLTGGLMQIGRNDDQAIQLDFGDNGISRSSHAVIAYDPEARKCYLGHGGKANLVRLNSGPVLSTVPLSSGDDIRISDTTMRFTAFCDDEFDWQED